MWLRLDLACNVRVRPRCIEGPLQRSMFWDNKFALVKPKNADFEEPQKHICNHRVTPGVSKNIGKYAVFLPSLLEAKMRAPLVLHHEVQNEAAGVRTVGVVELMARIPAAPRMAEPFHQDPAHRHLPLPHVVLLPVGAACADDAPFSGSRQCAGGGVREFSSSLELLDDGVCVRGIDSRVAVAMDHESRHETHGLTRFAHELPRLQDGRG